MISILGMLYLGKMLVDENPQAVEWMPLVDVAEMKDLRSPKGDYLVLTIAANDMASERICELVASRLELHYRFEQNLQGRFGEFIGIKNLYIKDEESAVLAGRAYAQTPALRGLAQIHCSQPRVPFTTELIRFRAHLTGSKANVEKRVCDAVTRMLSERYGASIDDVSDASICSRMSTGGNLTYDVFLIFRESSIGVKAVWIQLEGDRLTVIGESQRDLLLRVVSFDAKGLMWLAPRWVPISQPTIVR